MWNETLGVGLGLVPNVLRVERDWESEVANFEIARGDVFKRNGPQQHVVFEEEALGGSEVADWVDLSTLAIEAPLEDASRRTVFELNFQAHGQGCDRFEFSFIDLVGG